MSYHVNGWIKDRPDIRDITPDHEKVNELFGLIRAQSIPSKVDLTPNDVPIFDQGELGSCTANGQCGTLEYVEKKNNNGNFVPASRLFLYYVTRHLIENQSGDTGATIRDTMKALANYGACPETDWPYLINKFDKKPPIKAFTDAKNFEAVTYVSLKTLNDIKSNIAAGNPVNFGVTLYDNICDANGNITNNPNWTFPDKKKNKVIGGHAIVAIGYDDNYSIGNNKGAILFRNSWGTTWGNKGYGWLDYQYVLKGLATDWWTLLKDKYISTLIEELKAKI